MRAYLFPLGCMIVAALSGCSLLDTFFGVGQPAGTPVPADGAGVVVNTILPGAAVLLGLARWGYTEVRKFQIEKKHAALVAAGKKDENHDGEEDKPSEVKTI